MLTRTHSKFLAIAGAFLAAASAACAQDSGPLIDLLVKKGIVNDQEAEELKAELVKSYVANTSAGKLNLGSSVTDFKLSGDLRLRHQMETRAVQGLENISNERTRERFRFRFNGDVLLLKGWGAGFALETANAADSGNQTLENGNDDYTPYLARAYVSYKPNNNWFLTGGKFKNPLYTTDMVWDGDINTQGFGENYTYFLGGTSGKDTIKVRAGQFVMDDNNEQTAGPAGRDAWMFSQQVVYTSFFGSNNANSFVLAPGFMTYSASTLSGLANETPFNGTTRFLKVFTMPGEVNLAGVTGEGSFLKLYWDFAYNMEAEDRAYKAYAINRSFSEDATSWLLGVGYAKGTGKVQGDWSVKLDYRELGVGSIDPNISDSDFGFGNLNQRGIKLGGSYNVTDFASINSTYFYTFDKQKSLSHGVAGLDHSQILQIDLVVKF